MADKFLSREEGKQKILGIWRGSKPRTASAPLWSRPRSIASRCSGPRLTAVAPTFRARGPTCKADAGRGSFGAEDGHP